MGNIIKICFIYNISYISFVTKNFNNDSFDVKDNIYCYLYDLEWRQIFKLKENLQRFLFIQIMEMFDKDLIYLKFSFNSCDEKIGQCVELLNILSNEELYIEVFNIKSKDLYIIDEICYRTLADLIIYINTNQICYNWYYCSYRRQTKI